MERSEETSSLPQSVREELAALAGKTDEDIDYSDIPATKDEDWVGAVRGKFYRPDRQQPTEKAADEHPAENVSGRG